MMNVTTIGYGCMKCAASVLIPDICQVIVPGIEEPGRFCNECWMDTDYDDLIAIARKILEVKIKITRKISFSFFVS